VFRLVTENHLSVKMLDLICLQVASVIHGGRPWQIIKVGSKL